MRGLSSVPQPKSGQPSTDINLNDVIDAIRQTDREAFQSFQQSGSEISPAMMSTSYPPTGNGNTLKSVDSNRSKKQSYVKITEQPASKGLRFRYECEGRSAGSIPGVSSTPENKTYPTIQVVGYKGRAVVVVSCVSSEAPYKPHPHNLVGKEGCSKGVCTIEMDSETMSCTFPSLGIQCVKKKEIEESLSLRQQIRVDPFQSGFGHKDHPQSIDLNCVRLCYQVFLEGSEKGAFTFALKPVVSDPIYDKKARNDLTICRMTECSASVAGGKEILLFCEKVTKDDIEVRFYQEENGNVIWEGFGDFQPSDVHKQYGICFRTPRYLNLEVEQNIPVKLQLRRPSDGAFSESRPFELTPINGGRGFWASKRLKTNYSLFNNLLTTDNNNGFAVVSSSGIVQSDEPKRKIPGIPSTSQSPMVSPDSTIHHIVVPPPPTTTTGNGGHQITQPIQLVHASTFPPPPSPIKGLVAASPPLTCTSPDLPPPPTPLLEGQAPLLEGGEVVKLPPKSANMNLRPISDAHKYQDLVQEVNTVAPPMLVSSRPASKAAQATFPAPCNNNNAMDIDENNIKDDVTIYDEVIPGMYDEVDTKYDVMDFNNGLNNQPPAPPIRKRLPNTNIVNTVPPTPIEEPNKALPPTPSKSSRPSLISKFKSDKKERVKAKKAGAAPPSNSSNTVAAGAAENNNAAPRPTSLFQRLFHRSKSVDAAIARQQLRQEQQPEPEVPPHAVANKDDNGNENSASNLILDENSGDMKVLQDFIDGGNLEQLDNMVTEFAQEYMNDEDVKNNAVA